MNAIELLKEDHRRVRALFANHQKSGDRALVEKRKIAEKIFDELDVHAQIEEEIFYPAVREGATGDTEKLIAEAYEEHQVAKNLISELRAVTPGDEQWDAKMKVLQESIEHHVAEEEGELFPQAREILGATALNDLGARLAARKQELSAPSASLSGSLVKMVTRAYDSLTGDGKTSRRAPRKRASVPAKRSPVRRQSAAKSKSRGASKTTAARATSRTRRAVTRTVKKAASSRPVRAAKKAAARGKSRAANVRARVTKTVKAARKRAVKTRRRVRR